MKYTLSLLSLFLANSLHALPSSVTPTHGTVTHKVDGNTMTVTSKSPLASAKFGFDNNTLIAKGERIHIGQKKDATFIMEADSPQRADVFGKLTSQGSVVMAFPGGVHFKDGSTINVANLLVVAGEIDHTALIQNKIHIIKDSGVKGASIINDGNITIKGSGLAAFVAPNAANYGVIVAHEDKVYLGDGTYQGTVIDFYSDGIIKFSVSPACKESLEKARKTAKELAAQNGFLVFDTQQAIDILKGVVNTKIQNGDSVFVDINEDINIYCGTTPPAAPKSCGMNCGCGHVPASNKTQNPAKQSVPVSSSIPHEETKTHTLSSKDIIIVQDTTPSAPKTGPCDCGCAHAHAPAAASSHLTPSHTEIIKSDQINLYTIRKGFSPEQKFQTHDVIAYDQLIDEKDTIYEIKREGDEEEVFIIPPKNRRKKKLFSSAPAA